MKIHKTTGTMSGGKTVEFRWDAKKKRSKIVRALKWLARLLLLRWLKT